MELFDKGDPIETLVILGGGGSIVVEILLEIDDLMAPGLVSGGGAHGVNVPN